MWKLFLTKKNYFYNMNVQIVLFRKNKNYYNKNVQINLDRQTSIITKETCK